MTTATTPRRASIIHGYGATPDDHWFGWLAGRLRADGVPTTIPALPETLAPDPARWEETVRDQLGTPDEGSIVVAHSLGCLAVLRVLRSLPGQWRLGELVLVSGFVDRLPTLPDLDAFIGDGCDVTGLGDRIGRLMVLRSDADPVVPTGHTDRLARLLGVSPKVVPGAGHFLGSEGITSVPEVWEAIAA